MELASDLQNIRKAFEQGTASDFIRAVHAADWEHADEAAIEQVIRWAITLECDRVARELAQRAMQAHPDNRFFPYIATVLAPPRLLRERRPPVKGLNASIEWIRQNANRYRGQWVAVREGQLLAVASSRAELDTALRGKEVSDIVVYRVL